jgi:uncharacterized GH25 family protein
MRSSLANARLVIVTILLGLSMAARLSAHDFWLAVSPWATSPGQTVTLTSNVGENYPRPDSYIDPSRVEWARLTGPDGKTVDLPTSFSRSGNALATPVMLPSASGAYVAMVRLKPRFIELKAAKFTAYLKEEGLEGIVGERERLGERNKPGRERYSRWPKAIIRAGTGDSPQVTRPFGLTAEFVPATDPSLARAGDTVAFQLLFEGKPVPDAAIRAIVNGPGKADDRTRTEKTDAQGWVRFPITAAQPHLVAAVHMVRRSGETGKDAPDWESYWVSLAFKPAG